MELPVQLDLPVKMENKVQSVSRVRKVLPAKTENQGKLGRKVILEHPEQMEAMALQARNGLMQQVLQELSAGQLITITISTLQTATFINSFLEPGLYKAILKVRREVLVEHRRIL
jgi:hypothetical protein